MTARIPRARATCLCASAAGPSSSSLPSLSTRSLSSSAVAVSASKEQQRSHQRERREAHLERTQRQGARNIEKLITLYHSTSTFPTVAPRDSPAARALAEYVDGKLLENRKTRPMTEEETRMALEARRLAASGSRASGRAAPLMSLTTGTVDGSEEHLRAEYSLGANLKSSRQATQRMEDREHDHGYGYDYDDPDGLSTEQQRRQRNMEKYSDMMNPEAAQGRGSGAGTARRAPEPWRPFDSLASQREISRGKQVIDALVGTVQAKYAGPQLVSRLWEVNESWWAEETGRKENKGADGGAST